MPPMLFYRMDGPRIANFRSPVGIRRSRDCQKSEDRKDRCEHFHLDCSYVMVAALIAFPASKRVSGEREAGCSTRLSAYRRISMFADREPAAGECERGADHHGDGAPHAIHCLAAAGTLSVAQFEFADIVP